MSITTSITAEYKTAIGSGIASRMRQKGYTPGVLYGPALENNIMLALNSKWLNREVRNGGFSSKIHELAFPDGTKYKVIAKGIQRNPLTDDPQHIDFMAVKDDSVIFLSVPISFINHDKSPGLKRGGILNVVVHQLNVECIVRSIPEKIVIDLNGLNIHDSIQLKDVVMPENVKHRLGNLTIATIIPPRVGAAEAKAAK